MQADVKAGVKEFFGKPQKNDFCAVDCFKILYRMMGNWGIDELVQSPDFGSGVSRFDS